MNRRSVLVVVLVFSVLFAGIGWAVGRRAASPDEIAAQAAAPSPSRITAPVVETELVSRLVLRAVGRSSDEAVVRLSNEAASSVITALAVADGDDLTEGTVLAEVAGRPVIVLHGTFPAYRAMSPAMKGPDIEQLEVALLRLGYNPGPTDGLYTAATSQAVDALYRGLGYETPGPAPDLASDLASAEERVVGAKESLRIATSTAGIPESLRLELDQRVEVAARTVSDLILEQDMKLASSRDEVSWRQVDVESAIERREAAPAAALEAEAALSTAKAKLASNVEHYERVVGDAKTSLLIAQAARTETLSSYTVPAADAERAELQRAQKALADLISSAATRVPPAEVVFVPALPRRVKTVNAAVGLVAGEASIVLSGSTVILEGTVAANERHLLLEGTEVVVEDTELGISASARVSAVAETPGGGDVPEDRYAVEFTPIGVVPNEFLQRALRVTVPLASTGGRVLAVPLAAVSAAADGNARVEVEHADGTTSLVQVVLGLAADGLVAVEAPSGMLAAGDRVVVGRDLLLPGTSSVETGTSDS